MNKDGYRGNLHSFIEFAQTNQVFRKLVSDISRSVMAKADSIAKLLVGMLVACERLILSPL